MEFWENISKTVSDAADYTVKEAGKLTGIAKLKYRIAVKRARLDTLYAELGRLKYSEVKGAAPSGANAYNEAVGKIDTHKAELERYENELAKLKNVRICTACRSVIGLDMTFCPYCGAKQPEPPKDSDCGCGCGCGCGDDCDDDCDCDDDDDDCDCGCGCCCSADEEEDDDCDCCSADDDDDDCDCCSCSADDDDDDCDCGCCCSADEEDDDDCDCCCSADEDDDCDCGCGCGCGQER